MDAKTYEAIEMLLRGLVFHEQSGSKTPEHLAGQVRRAIATLSPEIAAEIEQDGPVRVYAERWDDAPVAPKLEIKQRGKINLDVTVTVTGPRDKGMPVARAIREMLLEADVACSMPEETDNPYDGDSIEHKLIRLSYCLRGDTRVIVQTSEA